MDQTLVTNDTITDPITLQKIYSREEAIAASLEYFNGDQLAAEVWVNKYALKDSAGKIYEKTPDDMHRRIAKELARVESKYPNPLDEDTIFELIRNFKYIVPQGSPMSGIGNDFQIVSLSNCFVIGNDVDSDSYGGLFKLDQELVQLQKRRAGVGLDLSFVRPKGSPVKNSALTSTGIVPFMERYSNSTREVAQDGRRGALMESFSIRHPDAEDFIDAKMTQGKVTGANVSMRIHDDFMKAAINGEKYIQKFPVDSSTPKYTKEVDAAKIWKKIVHNAWKSAEPGILFWDTIIRESVPDCYEHYGFKTISTNPCGEITLCANDSCRLVAINLYNYVVNPFSKNAYFDFELFKKHCYMAERLMDDIIDLELEKIDKIIAKIKSDPEPDEIKRTEMNLWKNIKDKCIRGRRTGLGITAEGDMMAALGLIYGSDESLDFAEEVHKQLKLSAYRSSVDMAKERDPFPIWDGTLEEQNPFLQRIKEEDPQLYCDMMEYGRRNIALLTIAPTGSVSILTQTTSGVEPAFLVNYMRRRKINPQEKNVRVDFVDEVGDSWMEYPVFHHKFVNWYMANSEGNLDYVKAKSHLESLSKEEANKLVMSSPYFGATSNDVDWVKKVEMQGRIQKHVDHSISVTVNLPENITEEIVAKVYETGWRSGCKGITVYRDGSRSGVLVSESAKKEKEVEKIFKDNHAPKRPKRLKGEIVRFQNNLEKWIGVVGLLDGRPYEIFTGKLENGLSELPSSIKECEIVKSREEDGSSRYDIEYVDHNGDKHTYKGLSYAFNPEFWNYAKLISSVLRHGMPMIYVQALINSLNLNDEHLNTWKNGIGRVVKKYIPDGEVGKGKCQSCGSESLQYIEGCLTCKSCGSSKCG
jgi:ribonucleoside-diphosphate reductase alpha chain